MEISLIQIFSQMIKIQNICQNNVFSEKKINVKAETPVNNININEKIKSNNKEKTIKVIKTLVTTNKNKSNIINKANFNVNNSSKQDLKASINSNINTNKQIGIKMVSTEKNDLINNKNTSKLLIFSKNTGNSLQKINRKKDWLRFYFN